MKVRVLCCVALSASVKVPLPLIALAKLSLMSVVTWFMVGPQWKLVSTCPADCLKTLLITWLPKNGCGLFTVGELKAAVEAGYAPVENSSSALCTFALIHWANVLACCGYFELLKATVVDPQTIDVQLRNGAVFSDGTPFDPDAVKFGLERNKANAHGQFRADLQHLQSVERTGPSSLRIHLDAPVAGAFYPLLGGQESFHHGSAR